MLVAPDSIVKPPMWGPVSQGLTDPKWGWFWSNLVYLSAFWERAGFAYDLSPYRANSSLSFGGSPTWDIGVSGSGMRFNGTSDYLEVGDFSQFGSDLTDVVTILAVVVPDDGTRGDYVTKWGSDRQYDLLQGVTSGKFQFYIGDGVSLYNSGVSTTTITAGERYKIAGKYDGSDISIHVNGTKENSNNIGSLTLVDSSSSLRIGASSDGAYFAGVVEFAAIIHGAPLDRQIADWSRDEFGPIRMAVGPEVWGAGAPAFLPEQLGLHPMTGLH